MPCHIICVRCFKDRSCTVFLCLSLSLSQGISFGGERGVGKKQHMVQVGITTQFRSASFLVYAQIKFDFCHC